MGITLVCVAAGLERDRPDRVALERDAGLLVQAGTEQVEVVNRGLILDLDPVRAGLDRLQILSCSVLDLDREARADLADQAGEFRLGWSNENDRSRNSKCHQ
jgi:hypothetical protein